MPLKDPDLFPEFRSYTVLQDPADTATTASPTASPTDDATGPAQGQTAEPALPSTNATTADAPAAKENDEDDGIGTGLLVGIGVVVIAALAAAAVALRRHGEPGGADRGRGSCSDRR